MNYDAINRRVDTRRRPLYYPNFQSRCAQSVWIRGNVVQPQLIVVQNWFEELRQRVPVN